MYQAMHTQHVCILETKPIAWKFQIVKSLSCVPHNLLVLELYTQLVWELRTLSTYVKKANRHRLGGVVTTAMTLIPHQR